MTGIILNAETIKEAFADIKRKYLSPEAIEEQRVREVEAYTLLGEQMKDAAALNHLKGKELKKAMKQYSNRRHPKIKNW